MIKVLPRAAKWMSDAMGAPGNIAGARAATGATVGEGFHYDLPHPITGEPLEVASCLHAALHQLTTAKRAKTLPHFARETAEHCHTCVSYSPIVACANVGACRACRGTIGHALFCAHFCRLATWLMQSAQAWCRCGLASHPGQRQWLLTRLASGTRLFTTLGEMPGLFVSGTQRC